MLDPELHDWGIEQAGGLSETVRSALRAWRRTAHVKPVSETDHEDGVGFSDFTKLPNKHQRTLMKLLGILSFLGEKEAYRLEIHIHFGSDGNNVLNIQDDDSVLVIPAPTQTVG